MLITRPTSVTLRVWPLAFVFFTLYGLLSLTNHLHLRTTGFDLGIFEQIVRSYAEFRAPVSELKGPGFVMLGDHFHPILATLAPLYWIFPSPITLLFAQAGLLAVSVVPVTRIAIRLVDRRIGLLIGVAYGLSWGLQTTVDFDFHEVVFAVPLLAFAIERLLREQWTAAVCLAAPLILVKEDLPLTVTVIGGYLFLKGQRRLGGWVMVASVLSFLVILKVLIPAMNPAGVYGFTGDLGTGFSLSELPGRLFDNDKKLVLLVAVFAPTALLALLSPVSLIAVPTLLWRLLSTNPSHWETGFHYGAVLMPIVFIAMVDALARGKLNLPAHAYRNTTRLVVAVCVVSSVLGLTTLPLGKLTDAKTWQTTSRITAAHRLMDMIPDGVTVAASNTLAPHLTNRTTVQFFPVIRPRISTDADWVIVDTNYADWPKSSAAQSADLERLRQTDYRTVAEQDGFVLLRRAS
ncbi:DUF2079 domain-containing protein [Kibdelosporangium philippinense]|uniref:DUF2079 domain-containing protein n=1 Tax=Kibdelosporangium philippinense TaxID=211113 RepID=A0ABS8Z410_9PSEU|nr:DUF2079 domain-containing protein [Kibdelosporangium philippinense]MCE7001525.1 DUF2079 domain-containing protein [Kibdelosporangium philippinense]